MTALRRKSQVLMDILLSGDKVETVIAQHAHEIDKQLIQMLDERIRAGMRYQSPSFEGPPAFYYIVTSSMRYPQAPNLHAKGDSCRTEDTLKILGSVVQAAGHFEENVTDRDGHLSRILYLSVPCL